MLGRYSVWPAGDVVDGPVPGAAEMVAARPVYGQLDSTRGSGGPGRARGSDRVRAGRGGVAARAGVYVVENLIVVEDFNYGTSALAGAAVSLPRPHGQPCHRTHPRSPHRLRAVGTHAAARLSYRTGGDREVYAAAAFPH